MGKDSQLNENHDICETFIHLKALQYTVYDINSDCHNLPHLIATSSLWVQELIKVV